MTTTVLTALTTTTQTLAGNDDIYIGSGVSLLVTGNRAITGTGGLMQVTNYGAVFSNLDTIALGAPDIGDVSLIFNGLGGTITAGGSGNYAAVFVQGFHSIENHGQIKGNTNIGVGIKTNDDGEIHNFGVISGRTGIINYGSAASNNTIINHGTVHGTNASIWVQNDAQVTIVNYGFVDGTVYLGNGGTMFGGSSFDSTEGAVRGSISGGTGNNFIASGRLGNAIGGGDGQDTLMGNGGNDSIFGDTGDDVVSGDEGNDTISVFSGDGVDTLDGGTGIDVLTLDRSLVIGAALTVSIAAPSVVQELADGTSLVNFERLSFWGGSGNDSVTGGALADYLIGNAGNDTLNGGAGNDNLSGGAGADRYFVDRLSDVVFEDVVSNAAAERDLVTYTGATGVYVLGANVEDLTLGGTAAINGQGNAAANKITGNAAANILNGMAGVDTLSGMGGADTYYVEVATDQVIESIAGAAGGVDHVFFSGTTGTFTLGTNVEKLTLTGSAAINGTGNSLANTIVGNSGSNVISGGAGNDTLTGGAGNDFFVFNTAPSSTTNRDTITDFSAPADTIRLENAIFTALGTATGALTSTMFKNVSLSAIDASDRILYNDATGAVLYDKDGSGAAAAIQFATISGAPTLTAADFIVI